MKFPKMCFCTSVPKTFFMKGDLFDDFYENLDIVYICGSPFVMSRTDVHCNHLYTKLYPTQPRLFLQLR